MKVSNNQCMGCQANWPLVKPGLHAVIAGYPNELVGCTARRYWKLIELAAYAYYKAEDAYVPAWLDHMVNDTPLTVKDRGRPIWYWALDRWGYKKWPRVAYNIKQILDANRKPRSPT